MDSQSECPDTSTVSVTEPVGVGSPGTSFTGHGGFNGYDSLADTSYHPYPPSRPFVNTDYQRSPAKPVMSFPESNRDGVVSALRSLQDKMHKLEFERRQAENNLHTLASETEKYKTSLHHPPPPQYHHDNMLPSSRPTSRPSSRPTSRPSSRPTSRPDFDSDDMVPGTSGVGNARTQPRELESQLSSAETRCQLLEKQLEYMRKMVQTAERDRTDAVQKAEVLQQEHNVHRNPSPFTPDYHTQLDRIGELERDHLRLTATQTLAELSSTDMSDLSTECSEVSRSMSKIKQLENKLKEERDHRRVLHERALDLESAAVSHQILLNSAPLPEKHKATFPSNVKPKATFPSNVKPKATFPSNVKPKKPPGPAIKKKKKVQVTKKKIPVKAEPSKHYRLNLAEIPFVAGKATTPSHAVGANVQKVLALMKLHNVNLCSSLNNGHSHHHTNGDDSPSVSSSSSASVDQDLADLLAQLQDEFGQLSFEHQEYMRQIHEGTDQRVQEDLERELDSLVLKMEAKGQQITKIRQHQQKLEDARRQAKRSSKKSPHVSRPSSASGRMQANHGHTRVRGNVRPKSASRGDCGRDHGYQNKDVTNPALKMLRNMKKLQSGLRRDDVCWE
ncbi:centrosomal protein of 57 kDa-like isoform X2 [Littorina saxatilis]|uniref:centrosomal protein of 57 kDa-like isoform X2 n=1 Tax=Littorina saxatilis TaxID=31220 RepID=UPI0038B55B16